MIPPEQSRHACGFALADQGANTRLIQRLSRTPEYSIQHAVMYTAANPARFEKLWREFILTEAQGEVSALSLLQLARERQGSLCRFQGQASGQVENGLF